MNNQAQSPELKKLRELIKDIHIAMLTTVDTTGKLHSRPMALNGEAEFDGDLWFFTYADSHKTEEIRHDSAVNVSFANPAKQSYVSISGRAELVQDRQKIEELWHPMLKAWFPEGKDDPRLTLLKVTAEQAEYWDAPSSFTAHVISLGKALLTGQPAQPGEHEKIDLGQAA